MANANAANSQIDDDDEMTMTKHELSKIKLVIEEHFTSNKMEQENYKKALLDSLTNKEAELIEDRIKWSSIVETLRTEKIKNWKIRKKIKYLKYNSTKKSIKELCNKKILTCTWKQLGSY